MLEENKIASQSKSEKSEKSVNRRQFVQSLGVVSGTAALTTFGVSNTSGKETPHIDSFNPKNKKEVIKATKQANKFEDEKAYLRNLKELTKKERDAIYNANSIHSVEQSVNVVHNPEKEDGDLSTEGLGIFLSAEYQNAVYGKNIYGSRIFKFVHHIRFKYNGDRVKDLHHYKTVGTGGIGWKFDKVTTNQKYLVSNGAYGISIMKGKFSHCLGGSVGCYNSRVIGSRLRALRQGGVEHTMLKG